MALHVYAKRSLVIVTSFVLVSLLARFTVRYFSDYENRGIYKAAIGIGYTLLFGALIGSLVHSIHMIQRYRKQKERKILLWLLIGLVPILYFLFAMLYLLITG